MPEFPARRHQSVEARVVGRAQVRRKGVADYGKRHVFAMRTRVPAGCLALQWRAEARPAKATAADFIERAHRCRPSYDEDNRLVPLDENAA